MHFLIPATIAQVFNSVAELVILIRIPSNEAKAEIKTRPVTAEATILVKIFQTNCSFL